MMGEILRANKFLLVVFVAVMIFGAYSLWGNNTDSNDQDDYASSLGSQLSKPVVNTDSGNDSLGDNTDARGIQDISGGSDTSANRAVYETTPPILEGYVAGYGTKTSGGRIYWLLLVATPQLDINGYEVDLRDMIGYRVADTSRWQEGQFVRIYGTFESETMVRARAIQ